MLIKTPCKKQVVGHLGVRETLVVFAVRCSSPSGWKVSLRPERSPPVFLPSSESSCLRLPAYLTLRWVTAVRTPRWRCPPWILRQYTRVRVDTRCLDQGPPWVHLFIGTLPWSRWHREGAAACLLGLFSDGHGSSLGFTCVQRPEESFFVCCSPFCSEWVRLSGRPGSPRNPPTHLNFPTFGYLLFLLCGLWGSHSGPYAWKSTVLSTKFLLPHTANAF